jgi:arylsulfatase A-like enzyme
MKAANILEDSIIVIHSDHGPSHLVDGDDDLRLWRKNSALFVSHTPFQGKGGVDNNYSTVSSLLSSLHGKNTENEPKDKNIYDLDHSISSNYNTAVTRTKLQLFSKGNTEIKNQ